MNWIPQSAHEYTPRPTVGHINESQTGQRADPPLRTGEEESVPRSRALSTAVSAEGLVKKGRAPAPPEAPHLQLAAHSRELEWKAFDAKNDQERVRLYLRAGDVYLATDQDIESALRCYSQALSYCDARELEFDPSDNWLVMALKSDRRKEP